MIALRLVAKHAILYHLLQYSINIRPQNSTVVKDTVSPAERYDFVSVKLENVHELFQVYRICGKGVVFYDMAQYGLLYHKSLCN